MLQMSTRVHRGSFKFYSVRCVFRYHGQASVLICLWTLQLTPKLFWPDIFLFLKWWLIMSVIVYCFVLFVFFVSSSFYFTFLQISTATRTCRTVLVYICLPVWQTGESPFRSNEACPLWVGLVVNLQRCFCMACNVVCSKYVRWCAILFMKCPFLCHCQMLKIRKSHVYVFSSWGARTQLTVSALMK